jgi:hypothetical protein
MILKRTIPLQNHEGKMRLSKIQLIKAIKRKDQIKKNLYLHFKIKNKKYKQIHQFHLASLKHPTNENFQFDFHSIFPNLLLIKTKKTE